MSTRLTSRGVAVVVLAQAATVVGVAYLLFVGLWAVTG